MVGTLLRWQWPHTCFTSEDSVEVVTVILRDQRPAGNGFVFKE